MNEDCFICRKHPGLEAQPPGGYLYEDERWRVCHAPAAMAVPGQVLIESRRHFLDFAEMTPEEAATYGALLARLYPAIKSTTGARRVYTAVLLDGAAHFHSWHVPHLHVPHLVEAEQRGIGYLAADQSRAEHEAAARALQAALGARTP